MHVQMAEIASMGPRSNGITIRDAADRAAEVAEPQPEVALDSGAEADLDFARQLQAKLDAQEARGGGGARSVLPQMLRTACPLQCHVCLSAAAPPAASFPQASTVCLHLQEALVAAKQ